MKPVKRVVGSVAEASSSHQTVAGRWLNSIKSAVLSMMEFMFSYPIAVLILVTVVVIFMTLGLYSVVVFGLMVLLAKYASA